MEPERGEEGLRVTWDGVWHEGPQGGQAENAPSGWELSWAEVWARPWCCPQHPHAEGCRTSSTCGAGDTEPLHQPHQTIMCILPKYPRGGWHEAHPRPAGCSPPPGAAEGPSSQHRGETLWVQLLPNAERCPPHPAVARRTSHTRGATSSHFMTAFSFPVPAP